MSDPIISLVMFAVVSTISPGGATTFATASGAQFGYVRSLPLVFGIATSLAALVACAATGLSSLLLTFPFLSFLMKLAGSAYLLWLALRIAKAGAPNPAQEHKTTPIGFIGGTLLLLVNPKAWAMAFGVAASFSSITSNPVELAILMIIVFATSATLSLSIWCTGGVIFARMLRTERQWNVLNFTLATLLGLSILQLWL